MYVWRSQESFRDYTQIIMQYGYVTLFVVAFPLAPLLAFVNNIVAVHVDAYKLTCGFQRPYPTPAHSIGVWFYFLDVISTFAIVTNCGIIFFTSGIFSHLHLHLHSGGSGGGGSSGDGKSLSRADKFMLYIIFQNSMLVVKRLLEQAIPEAPAHVMDFEGRFEHIVTRIFRGFDRVDVDTNEESERVNLCIHENKYRRRRQKTTAAEMAGEGEGKGDGGDAHTGIGLGGDTRTPGERGIKGVLSPIREVSSNNTARGVV